MSEKPINAFTEGPLGPIYARTALPIIFVMGMNGLLAVCDALFLGHFVGPEALAAVTLMFPLYMVVVALATLVSSGMSSLLARHLGAAQLHEAAAIFAGAHGLALLMSSGFILLFFALGPAFSLLAAGGSQELARMGLIYLRITVFSSPLIFLLSIHSDALRNEGRVALMAAMSLLVSIVNIGFNYMLIAGFHLGVAGSAYGTALAQALAFGVIIVFRLRGRTPLPFSILLHHGWHSGWARILALGAPQSLNFIGLALGSAAILTALQWVGAPGYDITVSAYGIITRVMTFAFLPLLGLSHAMQTITGNNFGAEKLSRTRRSLRLAVVVAFVYGLALQLMMVCFASDIGQIFVNDPAVVAEVARILPVMTALFFATGPLMMLAMHFQAIGDATRAAILGLSKPYLFAIPLTFGLSALFGEAGIWAAGPSAEAMLFILAGIVLFRTARDNKLQWGLLPAVKGERA